MIYIIHMYVGKIERFWQVFPSYFIPFFLLLFYRNKIDYCHQHAFLAFFSSTVVDDNMNGYFVCKNGQNVSWTSVCDGHNQCIDGSDERNCKLFDKWFSQ